LVGGEVGYDQRVGRRITIALDDDVRTELEAEMRKAGKSLKETVNETLRLGLGAQRKAQPFKIRARNLGLKPGYSLDKPWDLIEEIEGPGYK
jgi:Arc/MetJ family transcription regulator